MTCAVGSSYYLRFALTLAMPFVAIASYGVALAAAVVVGGGRPGRLTASAAAQRWYSVTLVLLLFFFNGVTKGGLPACPAPAFDRAVP